MRKIKKMIPVALFAALASAMLAGCADVDMNVTLPEESAGKEQSEDVKQPETEEAKKEADIPAAPYFMEGVYANYSEEAQDPPKTYFYVFNGDDYGYTADGENEGIGLPFNAEQTDGNVHFYFGGKDESVDDLKITDVKDNMIYGYFADAPDRPLVFELMEGLDAATFQAENYVNGPEQSVYRDATGWSIKYNANLFDISQDGPKVFIVYKGDSAGTNMITVTYTVDNDGEDAIKELGKSWGDRTKYSEGSFPGAPYAKGYWAVLDPEKDGSGMYMTAIARDYMDGALIFELTGHNGEDEEMNMGVSDALAGIIDSLSWSVYNYETIIKYLSDDNYYAYADMDKDHDALLVAEKDTVFDNGDGTMASTEADVYGYDEKDNIIYYGHIAGGGTATPLAAKDSELFYGGHNYMNKAHINEPTSELVTDEGEYFDEYESAIVIDFKINDD